MTTTGVRQVFERLIPDVLKETGFSEFKNVLRRPYAHDDEELGPQLGEAITWRTAS